MTFFKTIFHFCRAGYLNKDQMSEFSFENENQPVCSSVSSCLTLNVSSILKSSLSSLINTIFVCSSVSSYLNECFFNPEVFTLLFNKHHLCLFLSIFMFDSECFFNPEVFTLLFNKRHLYKCVWISVASAGVFWTLSSV